MAAAEYIDTADPIMQAAVGYLTSVDVDLGDGNGSQQIITPAESASILQGIEVTP